ncbi:Flp pilus assembly protein CpaB [Vibrio sp. SM6]|uniref:Flp pilus assembly protein CpaB n=1 Tax=Vibrio agarilyticus TaxID=2726741 RepID=A0A7X8YHJ2_9VIBR|nr:Flp pilus assembly protein CpaB [Vibrio agarilyticus]NLS13779.1 Flp pilus assembly protein CpaB [Vibrio agarilyticus]
MKKVLLLFIAGGAIIFGLYGLALNLTTLSKSPETVATPKEPQIQIWQYSQPVSVGQKVSRSHVKLVRLFESEANQYGVAENMEFQFEPGAVYREAAQAGDIAFSELRINPSDDGYVDLVVADNRVPYAIRVQPESIVGGLITHGSLVDVLSLSLPAEYSLDVSETQASAKRDMFVTPVLTGVSVLQVNKNVIDGVRGGNPTTEVNLILELTRKQVATLTVAKRISELEVHKSIGQYQQTDLHADAGDVLSNFKSIVEFRAGEITIN